MALTVQEVGATLVIVRPDAASLIESCLTLTSPWIWKSADFASGPVLVSPSADQTRKPNDLILSLTTFSASCDRSDGTGCPVSALRININTEIFGSPLLRM